ncbi:MAG: hypothetical protein ABIG28_02240 [archaeon]
MWDEMLYSMGLTQMDFVRFLLFLLFFILIFIALKGFGAFRENKGISIIISVTVSLFAARFVGEDAINKYILTPYRTLDLIFFVGGPFILLFFMAYGSDISGAARKMLWGFYAMAYAVVWFTQFHNFTEEGRIIFYIGAGLVVFMIIFDKAVKKVFRKMRK